MDVVSVNLPSPYILQGEGDVTTGGEALNGKENCLAGVLKIGLAAQAQDYYTTVKTSLCVSVYVCMRYVVVSMQCQYAVATPSMFHR